MRREIPIWPLFIFRLSPAKEWKSLLIIHPIFGYSINPKIAPLSASLSVPIMVFHRRTKHSFISWISNDPKWVILLNNKEWIRVIYPGGRCPGLPGRLAGDPFSDGNPIYEWNRLNLARPFDGSVKVRRKESSLKWPHHHPKKRSPSCYTETEDFEWSNNIDRCPSPGTAFGNEKETKKGRSKTEKVPSCWPFPLTDGVQRMAGASFPIRLAVAPNFLWESVGNIINQETLFSLSTGEPFP